MAELLIASGGETLSDALDSLRLPTFAGLPLTIRVPTGSHELPTTYLTFDNETLASEVWLVGDPERQWCLQPTIAALAEGGFTRAHAAATAGACRAERSILQSRPVSC